ncbi:response regulator [Opitutaceae bacterium EW11]|nr:response regulator [Opitutaceae bacterium EW11]
MARLLVVDDDLSLRNMLTQALSRHGHAVTQASNGREAWMQLQVGTFDLVLMDLIMPDVEGLETIRRMRSAGTRTKVLAMSGGGRSGTENILKMAHMLGASETIEKPFTAQELMAVVDRMLATP